VAAGAQLGTVGPFAPAVVGDGETAAQAGRRVAGGRPTAPPAYDPLEREPEVLAEQRVDHRVDGAVAVAQPEHDGEQSGLYARGAKSPYQVHGEERQPAHDETADDNAQRLGRLGLHPEPLHLGLDVPFAAAHHLRRELGLVRGPEAPAHEPDLASPARARSTTTATTATAGGLVVRR